MYCFCIIDMKKTKEEREKAYDYDRRHKMWIMEQHPAPTQTLIDFFFFKFTYNNPKFHNLSELIPPMN